MREEYRVALIAGLILSRLPGNVSGFIITINLFPIKAVILGGAFSNVGEKRFESGLRIRPFSTNADTSTTILGVSNVILYIASPKHGVPDVVLLRMKSWQSTIFATTVTLGIVCVEEIVMSYSYFDSTSTLAEPHTLSVVPLGQKTEDSQVPKDLVFEVKHPSVTFEPLETCCHRELPPAPLATTLSLEHILDGVLLRHFLLEELLQMLHQLDDIVIQIAFDVGIDTPTRRAIIDQRTIMECIDHDRCTAADIPEVRDEGLGVHMIASLEFQTMAHQRGIVHGHLDWFHPPVEAAVLQCPFEERQRLCDDRRLRYEGEVELALRNEILRVDGSEVRVFGLEFLDCHDFPPVVGICSFAMVNNR